MATPAQTSTWNRAKVERQRKDLKTFKIDKVGWFQAALERGSWRVLVREGCLLAQRREWRRTVSGEKWQLFQHIKDNLWLLLTSLCVRRVIGHLGGGRISLGTSVGGLTRLDDDLELRIPMQPNQSATSW